MIPLLVPGDSRALAITRSRTPAPLDLGFRLDGPHMKPLVHRSDEEISDEPDDQKPRHHIHRHVISQRRRDAVGYVVFANIVPNTGPKIPAIDHAVNNNPCIALTYRVPNMSRR